MEEVEEERELCLEIRLLDSAVSLDLEVLEAFEALDVEAAVLGRGGLKVVLCRFVPGAIVGNAQLDVVSKGLEGFLQGVVMSIFVCQCRHGVSRRKL